jgi:hypothetical protein
MLGKVVTISVAALTTAALVTGCGSSSKSSGDSTTTTAASGRPEDLRTTPAKVVAGLAAIDKTTTQIASIAATDKARAEELAESIEEEWEPIEGTIKENSADAYLTFEDQFAVLQNAAKAGDGTKAAAAAATVKQAVADYTAKYPG